MHATDGRQLSCASTGYLPSCRLKLARPFPGPALDHHLLFSVELNGVPSLGMHIAEEAFLPAREREESHRRSHADVDADIACPRLIAELACRGTTAREQARHIAKGGGIHHVDRFINRLYMRQAEYRPEDLNTGNLASWIDVIKYCRTDEVAPLVA